MVKNNCEMMKAIGGYFSWEFPIGKKPFPHENGTLVNSGHGALQLILQNIKKISKVWVPYFTCDIVLDTLDAIGVPYEFYHINFDLEIEKQLKLESDEYLIYTNYFGIMDSYVSTLSKVYGGRLIIDNAQAFFTPEIEGCHHIYSPRKFVGVPDGGIALSPLNLNIDCLPSGDASGRCAHLLQRGEGKLSEGYDSFKSNDNTLRNIALTQMSRLTLDILHSLDYRKIVEIRRSNYNYLHSALATRNEFSHLLQVCGAESFACPMIYPFYNNDVTLRSRLIDNHIFVAQYWPNVLQWCHGSDVEYALCNHIIPIPVDQRYGEIEMKRIINVIYNGI